MASPQLIIFDHKSFCIVSTAFVSIEFSLLIEESRPPAWDIAFQISLFLSFDDNRDRRRPRFFLILSMIPGWDTN